MTNMARPLWETGVAEGSFNRHAPLANRRGGREGRGVETSSVGRGGGGGVKFARESSDGFYRPVVDSF